MVQNRIYENILLSDYDVVVSLIEKGSRVLDLGCGNGSLLVRLIKERQVHARGVEIKQDAVRLDVKFPVPGARENRYPRVKFYLEFDRFPIRSPFSGHFFPLSTV